MKAFTLRARPGRLGRIILRQVFSASATSASGPQIRRAWHIPHPAHAFPAARIASGIGSAHVSN
jgi:hypothetical protein